MGNLSSIKDDANNSINYTYDSEGNKLTEQIKDASGTLQKSLSYSYDALNRLKRTTNPDASYTEYTYDSRGNRFSLRTPNSTLTTYAYDALNRLASTLQPLNASTSYTYNTSNSLASVKDANNNTTTYKMDDKGMDRLRDVDAFGAFRPSTGTDSGTLMRLVLSGPQPY